MIGSRYIFPLIVAILWMTYCESSSLLNGKTVKLVTEFFQTKRITKLTAFICWGKYNQRLMSELSDAGIQVYFAPAHNWTESLIINSLKRKKNIGEWWPVGVLLDASCSNFRKLLNVANHQKMFDSLHFWLILHEYNVPDEMKKMKNDVVSCTLDWSILKETRALLGSTQMLVDSEVTLALKKNTISSNMLCIFDIYRIRVNDPLVITPVVINIKNSLIGIPMCEPRKPIGSLVPIKPEGYNIQANETNCFILNLPRDAQPTSLRRKNFQGANLLAGTVIIRPELFTRMHDLQMRHVDTWTKINYVLVEHMSQDLNFTMKLRFFDNWGYKNNGSFDGLVGSLERRELDLGATGVLIKEDRLKVIDYVGDTFEFRATMVFRQPSLASITNIFLQPFTTKVWICAVFMLFINGMALMIEMKIEGKYQQKIYKHSSKKKKSSKGENDKVHWGDIIMMVVGAACQQGYYSPPLSLSARITFLALWLASLFLFTSYAANVVTLLQTPSHLVRSLSDLLSGPMEVGIQDQIYNYVYFQETTDPLARKLYHKKIVPKNGKAYYGAVEGMHRVQKGLFAFQVEHNIGYKIISETFTEEEKCGLSDVPLLPTPVLGIPLVRGSPYKEILAQKLRHLREVGVLDRTFKQWVPQKPSCSHSHFSTSMQFVSIGLEELHPSFSLLQAGVVISLILLVLEYISHRFLSRKTLI